jgi:glyoxylase-like metal-dependent hydrolase (beta-lactamase superfamily II)
LLISKINPELEDMKVSFEHEKLVVFESELMQTTCTLIIGERHLLLVDPNWLPSEVEKIAQRVSALQGDRSLYLYFTHSDYDHIIAYERFCDQAQVIVSQALLSNPEWHQQLEEIRQFYDQYYLAPPWPVSYPQRADLIIAQPAERHEIGGEVYHFYQALGHNRDGLIAFHETTGTLITGDYLCGVEFPFIYYSVLAYQKTLDLLGRLLNDLPVKTLVAGHGAVTQDKQEMQARWQASQWYLDALVAYGRDGRGFPETELWRKYPYFQHIQKKYHQANLALAKRELGRI